jgi:MFS family permease
MPLYLEKVFAANYRMVTLIPVVFGAGQWVANVPTGYLLGRFGRRLMIGGLLVIAVVDVTTSRPRATTCSWAGGALGRVGWAMFATAATTTMVNPSAAQRRGRAEELEAGFPGGQEVPVGRRDASLRTRELGDHDRRGRSKSIGQDPTVIASSSGLGYPSSP